MESFHDARATPNENKISYSGARRGSCVRSKAGGVTRGAVSCIAWLGLLVWQIAPSLILDLLPSAFM